MSRSRKKNPIRGHTAATSERFDKQMWHRRCRKQEKERLDKGDFDSPTIDKRDVSDVWLMHKDGKSRCPEGSSYYTKAFRK